MGILGGGVNVVQSWGAGMMLMVFDGGGGGTGGVH